MKIQRGIGRIWWNLALAWLGLGLALTALWLPAVLNRPQPGVTYGPATTGPLAADKSLGINVDLSGYDAPAREEALAAMEAAGFRWLRQRFPWAAIEPQPGIYDWDPWDRLVEAVTQHNLGLIAVLDGSPAWARAAADAGNSLAPPAEVRDYGAFVAAFAGRYGHQIDHYQLWDEPNIAPHWGARQIDPAAYARLLREGVIQVRAADPGGFVLLAALAPNVETGGANMSELQFLDALYRAGAAEWFDVVAAQPYGFGQPLAAPPEPVQLNWKRIALLREKMVQHGDGGTAVWATSFGLVDSGEAGDLAALWAQARADWPWLGPMLWEAWAPDYALAVDGQLGPHYQALRDLAMAEPVAWPGRYPADHATGRYGGDWRLAPAGADIGGSGDRLAIPFRGTRLDLVVRRGDYRAFLFVTVDGRPANALPQDTDGNAYLVLYDPRGGTDTVTLARALADGEHRAEIVADRGWGQWAIVGWDVWRERPADFAWLGPGLGLAAAAVLGLACYRLWPQRRLLLESVAGLVDRYRVLDERLTLALTAAAALLVYVVAGTVPTLATLAFLALFLLLRPEMGLPLIALALPFYQPGVALLGKIFSLVEILTLLTACGALVHWVLGIRDVSGTNNQYPVADLKVRFSALDWGVLALVLLGALSLLWSEYLREAAREYRTVVLEAGLFYLLLRLLIRSRRDLWRVAGAWLLGGALIAAIGLGQWVLGQDLITADGVGRVRGLYGSPNNLALYLGRVLPLAVALAVWGRGRRWRWALGGAAVLMGLALLLTYSRGAWLLGVPAALLFLAAMRSRRALLIVAGLLAVTALLTLLVLGPGRLLSLLDTSEGTTFFRLQLWHSSLAMIGDRPLTGVGLDNFLYAYRSHYVLPTAWEEFGLSHPHNLVLDFWLRLGLPGLVVLAWLLVAYFRWGLATYGRLPEGHERLLVLGLLAGMVNFVAHGLVDNAFFLVDLGFVFVLMLALLQSGGLEAQNQS